MTLQWFVCDAQFSSESCVARTGQAEAQSLSYKVRPADVSGRLVAQQVARNAVGEEVRNTATDVVAAIPPSATPVISGTTRVGEVLTGSEGFLSGTAPSLQGVQWVRCEADGSGCAAIEGATSYEYLLTGDDAGKTIRFEVTVQGPQHTVSIQSEPTVVVEGVPIPGDPGIPAPPQPDEPAVRALRPFPSIVIAGRAFSARAVVSTFLVRGPKGARVSVTCRGRDCPVRRARRRIRRSSVRLRRFETALVAGTVIEIRVTGANRIGKFMRLRILGDRPPARTDRCLRPGSRRPVPCPRGVG